ncbi:hypothetical protein ACHHYP_12708 [Achlya hypogyna]|uniref:Cyclic nucleotide-binding domain-containing protein n=1 Tax=Achlya hypogyna TaxID=1202772 RepID=A0A1V9ZGL8_ACHHY|nr:hypothetical protein ACHHYP_12708 [Achlya hypogyna]
MSSNAAALARWKKVRSLLASIRTFTQKDETADAKSNSATATAAVLPFAPQTWTPAKARHFQRAYDKLCEYRNDADLKLLMEIVQSVAIFAHVSYLCKTYICASLQCLTLHDGQVVYHQGERINAFSGVYLVLEGVLSVYKNTTVDNTAQAHDEEDVKYGECITTATVGDVVGEAVLQGMLLRQYTVLAQSRAKVAMISQAEFKQIVAHDRVAFNAAEYVYSVQCEAHRRTRDDNAKLVALLQTFRIFRSLSPPALEKLTHKLMVQNLSANAVLLDQESVHAKFIIVVSGRVQIYVAETTEGRRISHDKQPADNEASQGTIIGDLTHGECFGEVALVQPFGAAQVATLRTVSPVTAIVLLQSDWLAAVRDDPDLSLEKPPDDKEDEEIQLRSHFGTADRSEEVVHRAMAALLRADARLFFRQLSPAALHTVARHAQLRTVDADAVLLEQNYRSDGMWVVLSGVVHIFRVTAKRVYRRQSVVVPVEEAEAHDTFGQRVSSLGVGSAFGHVPTLTDSVSQSTYLVGRSSTKGTGAVLLLVPAAYVRGLLQPDEEALSFQPRLVLEAAVAKPHESLEKLARYLGHSDVLRALPNTLRLRLLQGMEIVDIRHNQLLWDEHEWRANVVLVVLAGTLLLVHSGHAVHGGDWVRPSKEAVPWVFDPHRTANTITRMNRTDTTRVLAMGDVVGVLQREEAPQRHSAIALTDGKVGVLHWSLLRPSPAPLLQLTESILQWHRAHEKDAASTRGVEELHGLVAQLLDMTGLKDQFPVELQSAVPRALVFAAFAAGDVVVKQGEEEQVLYVLLDGSVDIFVQRPPPVFGNSSPAKPKASWSSPSKRKFTLADNSDPMKALQQLSKDPHLMSSRRKSTKASDMFAEPNHERFGVRDGVLTAGDILGDRALFTPGATHFATMVAATSVTALVLPRHVYEHLATHDTNATPTPDTKRNTSGRARDHWKLIAHFILKRRAQRSQWPSVIEFARQKRIRLVMEIVQGVACFKVMPPALRQQICERTLFQTYAANAYVFCKGKPSERFYVVVSGTVDLVQSSVGAVTDDSAEVSGYVKVCSLSDGDTFGEFELLAGDKLRQISAVTPHGVRLVAVNKAEFMQSWPGLARMHNRLNFLQTLDAFKELDKDRVCSMWYGLVTREYRRTQVIVPFATGKVAETLYIIENGECVVERQINLHRSIQEKTWQEPDIHVDAQVATLSRGNVLLCEEATWKALTMVASTRDATLLVLSYPGSPFQLQRVLGKRGMGMLRKITRVQLDWHRVQENTAAKLAVESRAKPLNEVSAPIFKCVPVAKLRQNRLALPRFLLQRNSLRGAMPKEVAVGPRMTTLQTSPTGSFAVAPSSPEAPSLHLVGPVWPKAPRDDALSRTMRLQRLLQHQIRSENQLAHALDVAPRATMAEASLATALRRKHGRPPAARTTTRVFRPGKDAHA